MNKTKTITAVAVLVILALIILFGIFYTPKYKGKEIKTNQICALVEKDNVFIIVSNNNDKWSEVYRKEEGSWKKSDEKEVDISGYHLLSSKEINNNKLNNFSVDPGGHAFHEPLKKLIQDNNRYGLSVGIGLEYVSDDFFYDYISLRIYKDFKEYTYRYEIKDNKVELHDSFYYSILY